MTRSEGTVGELDGWVSWTTCDSAWSYLPTLACGHFMIVLGRGKDWGASDEDHGVADVVTLDDDEDFPTNDDPYEVAFSWSLAGAERAVREIAERMDHPVPSNVVEAVREIWFALFQQN